MKRWFSVWTEVKLSSSSAWQSSGRWNCSADKADKSWAWSQCAAMCTGFRDNLQTACSGDRREDWLMSVPHNPMFVYLPSLIMTCLEVGKRGSKLDWCAHIEVCLGLPSFGVDTQNQTELMKIGAPISVSTLVSVLRPVRPSQTIPFRKTRSQSIMYLSCLACYLTILPPFDIPLFSSSFILLPFPIHLEISLILYLGLIVIAYLWLICHFPQSFQFDPDQKMQIGLTLRWRRMMSEDITWLVWYYPLLVQIIYIGWQVRKLWSRCQGRN